jgi:hypothetical protein
MAIGAYSVVRFADSMRDERVNLGVIVWHPHQGFSWIIPKSLDRAKAVNPLLDSRDIKSQIAYLRDQLETKTVDGLAMLTDLSKTLSDGFQVSAPYPTRLSGVKECADHLFQLLVAKVEYSDNLVAPEMPVRERLVSDLRSVSFGIDHNAIVQEMGERHIANVRVNLGIRTSVARHDLLWRMVSLATNSDDRISRAKAAAMDIVKIRGLGEFGSFGHAIAAHSPKKDSGESFDESRKWLLDQTPHVLFFKNPEELPEAISAILKPAA